MSITYPTATLQTDGLIHCGLCPVTLPANCWGLMDKHIEVVHHLEFPKRWSKTQRSRP